MNEQTRQTNLSIVNFFKSRPDLCRIGITELPYDSPEIASFKSEKVLAVKELIFDRLFSNFSLIIDDKITISIISPALISAIYSNFLLGDVIRNVMGVEFDDAFYERYSETISTFLFGGIMAVAAELQNKKGASLF